MKTLVLTTAGTLLLSGGGIGYAVHANADTTPVQDDSVESHIEKVHVNSEDIEDLLEYDTLDDIVEADDFNAQVVENNAHKRVIVLTDDNGQPQFKSIFVKDTNRLKIIDFKAGLVFDQILGDDDEAEADDDTVENEDSDNEAVEEGSDIEDLVEYDTLDDVVDVDDFNAQIVEDSDYKRVIVLTDDSGQAHIKSIFVKDTNRLKVIDFQTGLVFNQVIGGTDDEQADADDNADDQTIEEGEDNEVMDQEADIEGLTEYETLNRYVDVDAFNSYVVEDNTHKRIIVLKDDNGQAHFKSIYVKDLNSLKIINTRGGLVYNGLVH
ncbi:hypothetical protein [Lentibacillus saliphilus]|uniref:hypothetical protein n=1 Tax=Lentibacillus saliphilus TaxID=2737028 RepID=UPI001C2F8554|nr:hypothetical protein [Lentibacillus saliphilus]